ncbi:hypothetical protein ACWC09_50540 [Streptomyces sp. NPDC001617]
MLAAAFQHAVRKLQATTSAAMLPLEDGRTPSNVVVSATHCRSSPWADQHPVDDDRYTGAVAYRTGRQCVRVRAETLSGVRPAMQFPYATIAIPWSRFVEVAEQLACHLDELPRRVNYRLRRRTLATWQMPHTDWTELCDGLPQASWLTSRYGTMLGTVLVWAETTQSDYLLCPLLRAPRTSGIDLTSLIDKNSQFLTPANQNGRSLESLRNVAKYSRDLGAHCDK